jgi:hypothetical protein
MHLGVRFGIQNLDGKMIVETVDEGGRAALAGTRAGDVWSSVSGKSVPEFVNGLANQPLPESLIVCFERGGIGFTIPIDCRAEASAPLPQLDPPTAASIEEAAIVSAALGLSGAGDLVTPLPIADAPPNGAPLTLTGDPASIVGEQMRTGMGKHGSPILREHLKFIDARAPTTKVYDPFADLDRL